MFWEVWRSSRGYVACRFFVSSCLSFWHLACLCSLFELESLVYVFYSDSTISVIDAVKISPFPGRHWTNSVRESQSPWFPCDRVYLPSQSALENLNRGKTNPTFLCASWFLKRMYRPCLMIIIKSCYLDCQIPELFTSSHCFVCVSCSVLITYKLRLYIWFFINALHYTARWPRMWSAWCHKLIRILKSANFATSTTK